MSLGDAPSGRAGVTQRVPNRRIPAPCHPPSLEIGFRSTWLAHPAGFLAVGSLLICLPALVSTSSQHHRWGTPWYVTWSDYALIALGITALAAGIAVGIIRRTDDASAHSLVVPAAGLVRASNVLFSLCMFGYLVWAVSAVAHGMTVGLALDTLRGSPGAAYRARELLVTVPGLSTLTEVAPCLVAVLVVLWRGGIKRPRMMAAVLLLSVLRAFLNSERLSLIAIAVPFIVVAVTVVGVTSGTSSPRRTRWAKAGLMMSPLMLIAWFAITERGRSWGSQYATRYDGGLVGFSLDRIAAYYATATNNGVIYHQHHAPHLAWPELSLSGVADAPIIGELLGLTRGDVPPGQSPWHVTLSAYANPEFNNPGSLLPIIGEIGWLAFAMFAIWGMVVGRLYSAARQQSVLGIVAYATVSVGLLELARYPYYTSSRAVVAVLALVVVYTCISSESRRESRTIR